ncbi:hypothetical protein B0T18DRAFT_399991 [Schizothecium vesticola]|uniref:Uncharacterized protein n=1 Tax=Schizothecium vesticola TaxID=314040 RepID=A0AA40KDE4_9PEZI|nr:hypothetical protein B0T18DRAFT_399991 [Schizothecium vesticola]
MWKTARDLLFPAVFPSSSTPPRPINIHIHGSACTSASLSDPATCKPAGNQPVKTSSLPFRRTLALVTGILAPFSARVPADITPSAVQMPEKTVFWCDWPGQGVAEMVIMPPPTLRALRHCPASLSQILTGLPGE